jgi:hypothetical protein
MPKDPWTEPRRLALRAVATAHLTGVAVRLSNHFTALGSWDGASQLNVHWQPLGWLREQGYVDPLGETYPDSEQSLPTTAGVAEARRRLPDLFPGASR